jgi:hypothetical protein
MPALYLTPASQSYLAQLSMALLITGYLVISLLRPDAARARRPAHMLLLTGFFACITLLSFLFFLDAALPPTERLLAVYLENTVLGVGIVLLLQFTYRFPSAFPRSWEARLVLGLSGGYTLYEAQYALYRYWLILAQGQVIFRPEWADYPIALGLLWVLVMLARQSVRASKQSPAGARPARLSGLFYLWRPQGRAASAARALALAYLAPFGVSLLNILKTFYFISADLYQLSLSVGIMLSLATFAVIYLNHLPETTSFVVKLVGVTLVALLAVLGAVGWALTPVYARLYRPVWPDRQTVRFTPNVQGGYDMARVPFHFESDLGDMLNLLDTIRKTEQRATAKLDFDFPFYGKTFSQVYATNDGAIAMGQSPRYFNYQYHYGGAVPLILPILTDLIPGDGTGQVFARRDADRLILTWDRVPSFYHREAEFTFQVVLYHSGAVLRRPSARRWRFRATLPAHRRARPAQGPPAVRPALDSPMGPAGVPAQADRGRPFAGHATA